MAPTVRARDLGAARFECNTYKKDSLIKSFDKIRTNDNGLIPLVVSLSNHERNQLTQSFQKGWDDFWVNFPVNICIV